MTASSDAHVLPPLPDMGFTGPGIQIPSKSRTALAFNPSDSPVVFATTHFQFKRDGTIQVNGRPPLEEFEHTVLALWTVNGCIQLWIGDLIVKGRELYGTDFYQVVEGLDYHMETLKNYESASRSIPPSLRNEGIDWGHYQAVLGVKDPQDKAKLLKDAIGTTVRDFRRKVEAYKALHLPVTRQPIDTPETAPAVPDDREIEGEYDRANYRPNLQGMLQECADAFTLIQSLTTNREILDLCRTHIRKIGELFQEML